MAVTVGRKLAGRRQGGGWTSEAGPGTINHRRWENSFGTSGGTALSAACSAACGVAGAPFLAWLGSPSRRGWGALLSVAGVRHGWGPFLGAGKDRQGTDAQSWASMACVCRPRRLPAWCCALSPAPRLGVIILINPNCGTLAREMHGADRGTQLRGVTHTLAPKRACGSSRPAGGGGGACSGLKKEPAPPQGKENSRQSQPRTRVVTIASVSATSAPALTCSRARLPAVAALPPSPCLAPLPFPRPLLSQGPGSTLRHPEPPRGLRRAERYCYSRDDSGGANVPRPGPGPAPHAPHLPVLTATL